MSARLRNMAGRIGGQRRVEGAILVSTEGSILTAMHVDDQRNLEFLFGRFYGVGHMCPPAAWPVTTGNGGSDACARIFFCETVVCHGSGGTRSGFFGLVSFLAAVTFPFFVTIFLGPVFFVTAILGPVFFVTIFLGPVFFVTIALGVFFVIIALGVFFVTIIVRPALVLGFRGTIVPGGRQAEAEAGV